VLSQLPQLFWKPSALHFVKRILMKCVICRKVSGTHYSAPYPSPLPKVRLPEAPPFTATGIYFTNVDVLFDIINLGVDFLLVKHEKACNNESTVKYDTTSRCTALEDTHVNKLIRFC
jgi:hypothetical protein